MATGDVQRLTQRWNTPTQWFWHVAALVPHLIHDVLPVWTPLEQNRFELVTGSDTMGQGLGHTHADDGQSMQEDFLSAQPYRILATRSSHHTLTRTTLALSLGRVNNLRLNC